MNNDATRGGGTQWELDEAWRLVIQARNAGDTAGEALGMRRFSEGLRNSSLGVVGSVLAPLDGKIDKLAALINRHYEFENKRASELRTHIDGQFDRIYQELDRLGGLETRVERVELGLVKTEIRLEAVETHGAPAKAVDELHLSNKRIGRLEVWVAILTIAIAANALIYLILAISGGGR